MNDPNTWIQQLSEDLEAISNFEDGRAIMEDTGNDMLFSNEDYINTNGNGTHTLKTASNPSQLPRSWQMVFRAAQEASFVFTRSCLEG